MHLLHLLTGLTATTATLTAAAPPNPPNKGGAATHLTGYEYIVIGSGAGGGPLAARLALAGHKTLLIEAGDDQGSNDNYTVPAYHARSTEDPAQAWDFYVRHYTNDTQQRRDWKLSYDTPSGSIYTGLSPPPGSTVKGVLYPRAGTLGGCTAHNALITAYPHRSDFEYIAQLTGDPSWAPEEMRKHFVNLERKRYYTGLPKGHGKDGWLTTELTPLAIPLADPQLLSIVTGGALALGNLTDQVVNVATLLAGDLNADTERRDGGDAYYQVPISTKDHVRTGSREFVLAVRDAVDRKGRKMYPLDVRLNCLVTRVVFDDDVDDKTAAVANKKKPSWNGGGGGGSGQPPRATGVEFLDGAHLYRASKLSSPSRPGCRKNNNNNNNRGMPGSATASREVIIAGGAYNSPQILKLSGIGPKEELARFGIPLVVDLPGVGANLQDHYETSVNVRVPKDWISFTGCTFGQGPGRDLCLERWKKGSILGNRWLYSTSGFAAAMLYKSTASENGNFDVFAFGGPVNFRGYYPDYSSDAVAEHNWWSWAILKAHPRMGAGRVTLRSADPLDTPEIVYNFFDESNGEEYKKDLRALREGIELARTAMKRQLVPTREELPGKDVETEEEIEQYVKDGAWGHHASCTCPIGPDGDPMAVLDSKFRVRGVRGLRVVDASVYPRIPGTFTAVSTYMVAEKAASDILAEL